MLKAWASRNVPRLLCPAASRGGGALAGADKHARRILP